MRLVHVFVAFSLLSISGSSLHSQENLRNQLFGEVNVILAKAQEKKADLYSPRSYERATRYYTEATDYFTRGGNLESIRERIENARVYFAKALDQCSIGEATLSGTMAARTDAFSAGAPKYSPKLWMKAEELFKDAGRDLEDGDLSGAKNNGIEAEGVYRSAELEAIEANYLSPARILLKQADDMSVSDNTPKTLEKARALAAKVETLLKQNRYDTDEARQLAQEAKYEAAHALYLHQLIARMNKDDKTFEDAMLAAEEQFQKVAGKLGIQARFESGYAQAVGDMTNAIKAREAKSQDDANALLQATETIRGKEKENENLREQVAAMEKRLGTLTEAEVKLQRTGKDLERKLESQRQQEETIRQTSTLFTEEEGNVLRDGNSMIIRLYGLTFPVGRSTIEPQYYTLLTKVQDAIKKFPGCKVTIEGHTDSQGSDEANQTLSESRAKSVAEYLMANMGVQIPVESHGFGESRPIASNDTPDGRAMNRRIDVVITPESAPSAR